MSAQVHAAWLSRPNNSWTIEYQTEESKPYEELPESVKAKDRSHIELAIELSRKVESVELTYETLKSLLSSSISKFNSQITQLEGSQK